jgi:hypothetical protein
MRLRNRVLTVFLLIVISAAIGLAVSGIPQDTPLDPMLDLAPTTTSTTSTTFTATTLVSPPPATTATTTTSSVLATPDEEIAIQILNAGVGPGGAALAAESLDLSLAEAVLLGNAPTAQNQSSMLYRSDARLAVDAFIAANPQLALIETTEITMPDEWPEWADLTVSILILVAADWPQP